MDLIRKYFPEVTDAQLNLFTEFHKLFTATNEYVNLISRKDMDYFVERHVLHSLSIAKFMSFPTGVTAMDLGSGGGFPGLPLAVMFPDTQFVLVDSIAKKMRAVREIKHELSLDNVKVHCGRAEEYGGKFDYILSRAVAPMESLIYWTNKQIKPNTIGEKPTGIIALKGGDLTEELANLNCKQIPLSTYFEEEFFETKKLVYWAKH